ncbi:unnamed protein product (macronuclear) [Paramecium tetraurelia]|uniref:COMM domain-containing protein n=1 Tax=Paramecium tetraurelia TaxID=5888 RepID=A0DY16_PARTE|nr:uncharacterized protein GSPATT00021558001 [Paramecium tetraurelia]CAK87933.1 unnamed protein product [Paramecium tetraurelia]|eukprot:XP_001455330.1 hypothetical protein (macronuclear) [Paramecium tetraurelia strain d4-2]
MSVQEFIANKKMLDVEWRFSSFNHNIILVATANSSKENYSDCFLQLKIKTIDKNMVEETTHFELTLAQFNELFTEIEKVKNLMSLIK